MRVNCHSEIHFHTLGESEERRRRREYFTFEMGCGAANLLTVSLARNNVFKLIGVIVQERLIVDLLRSVFVRLPASAAGFKMHPHFVPCIHLTRSAARRSRACT